MDPITTPIVVAQNIVSMFHEKSSRDKGEQLLYMNACNMLSTYFNYTEELYRTLKYNLEKPNGSPNSQ